MDLDIVNVHYELNEWEVTRAIAAVLHTRDEFKPAEGERQLNFKVHLRPCEVGVRNDGTGILTLPSHKIGQKFLKWVRKEKNCIPVGEKNLRFFPARTKPLLGLAMTLDKTPYLDPDIEEERQTKIRALNESLRVDKVQFGLFYRPSPGKDRNFSVEWECFMDKSPCWLSWEYEHKLIRVQIGNRMTEETGSSIVIKFSNIRKLGINYDFGNPFLCFDLVTPPMLEEEDFNRPLTGNDQKDNRKFRRRVGSLHPGHARVAPYCHHLRIVLYQDEDLDKFEGLCKIAGLQRPIRAQIDAYQHGFCSQNRLHMLQIWLRSLDWRVAFQLEAILHNALLNTEDLLTHLYEPINKLYKEHRNVASEVLRYFTEALQSISPKETPLECFERTRARKLTVTQPQLPPGTFHCHHVCFAPTRMILEGPYVIQSNRVIREWAAYQDNFIRVDFRDEDRLQYRWDREVDGKTFLEERVGGILKNGFELAGRKFEFLAYSSSALREHAVWFMQPFHHPDIGCVDSNYIRDTLGEFPGVIHQPSKYAARIAQAFTATDPSVRITRDQWEEVDELGTYPYYFTDGVGTISQELGDRIWKTLCDARRDHGQHAVKPSAYQIRFLGYKGVVGIDEHLPGIMMRLRPSMNKFKGREDDDAEIEIAKSFSKPNTSYLNRQMVMILEDRGVTKESFMTLQDIAVAEARTIDDSLVQFRQVLKAHNLGGGYRLDWILERLMKLGLDLKCHNPEQRLDNAFLGRVRHFTMTHVLRDIKHGARIPIPKSWLLVGVADEGPAYVAAGYKNVYQLQKGKIYACVQAPDDESPTWLKGSCTISRSPVVHPGDIQRVYAIGQPPEDQLCLFRNMKNVVVLPSTGIRSLASCLGGGDLDGDLYDVVFHGPLLPTEHVDPAEYPPGKTRENENRRPSTVNDICDFIVEYVNSDVLGLLSDRHLTIADQSKHGTRDENCKKLAELCSQAVDYPKNGIPVNIDRSPRLLIPYKPDWHAAEVAAPRRTDYYDSDRALGHLYRAIEIDDPALLLSSRSPTSPSPQLIDPISMALKPVVQEQLQGYTHPDEHNAETRRVFQLYVDELAYICLTHTVTATSDVRLQEEEIVVGTILAKCSQRRWRKDRMHRMRTHSQVLVQEVQRELMNNLDKASSDQIREGLMKAWRAWEFSLRHSADFGANSFGLIALGIIFNCLEKLEIQYT